MKKFFIVFLLLILFIPLVSCTSNNEQDNTTPTQTGTNPTKTPNKPTPTPTVEDLYTVNYYVNGTFVYGDKTTIAKNYTINTKDILLSWYTNEECTNVYNFNEKLTADINLYAKTVPLKDILDAYFTKKNITEFYFEGQNDTNNLKIERTNRKIKIVNNEYDNTSGYIISYYRYEEAFFHENNYLRLTETCEFDFLSGNFFVHSQYHNPNAWWPQDKHDIYIGKALYSFSEGVDSSSFSSEFLQEWYLEYDEFEQYITSFFNKACSYLKITVTSWKKELYGDKISTGGTYVLNVDLDKILAEGDN